LPGFGFGGGGFDRGGFDLGFSLSCIRPGGFEDIRKPRIWGGFLRRACFSRPCFAGWIRDQSEGSAGATKSPEDEGELPEGDSDDEEVGDFHVSAVVLRNLISF
jgi:hypothetical protein